MKTVSLNTAAKIQIGRLASIAVRAARSALGKSTADVNVTRRNINWQLDLKEGIDLSIFLFGRFEVETAECIDSHLKDGDGYLDIGANIGAHVLHAAKCVGNGGQIIAVEPTEWALAKLKRNVALNPNLESQIEIIQGFVTSGKEAPDKICSSWNFNEEPDHKIHKGVEKSTKGTRTVSLDELILRFKNKKIGLVKIDVDGFEIDVLKSGSKELPNVLPAILIEFAPYCLVEKGHEPLEMINLIRSFGYKTLTTPSGKQFNCDDSELVNRAPEHGGINLLFTR